MNEYSTTLVSGFIAQVRRSRLKHRLAQFGDQTHKVYESVVHKHLNLIEQRQKIFIYQLVMLAVVILTAGVISIVKLFDEDVFVYPYLVWSVSTNDVLRFWPLLFWGFFLSVVVGEKVYSSHLDGALLRWGLLTGNLAALWEELGYRGVFIAGGMLSVFLLNWFFSAGLGWIVIIACVLWTLGIWASEKWSTIVAIIPIGIAVLSGVFLTQADPVYWLYQSIMLPALNFLSFGSFTEIINNTAMHDPLFVMDAIAANAWFRDGHKYQGWFGVLDSWMFGFVAIYAMMTYGLLTALTLHMAWNTQVYVIRYLKRKVQQITT